jgi:heptosyltransferase-2
LPAPKILLLQTAFIGDAILASSILETIHLHLPDAAIHLLVRKGNEGIFLGHPFLTRLWVWNKKDGKYGSLLRLGNEIRKEDFDYCINMQRFGSTGLLTIFSGATTTIGFDKNPFSRFFTYRIPHVIGDGTHETGRNHQLLAPLLGNAAMAGPRIYPSAIDQAAVSLYQGSPYVCMAPTSVWYTKQWPSHKWTALCNIIPAGTNIYLLGSPADHDTCEAIRRDTTNGSVKNLCGTLSLLQSAALMQGAVMNYVNDSAPMHLCSAVNAPVTAIYCSTVPEFGFGPLSAQSRIRQRQEPLYCRPCGIHGYRACPEGHFKCAEDIDVENVI